MRFDRECFARCLIYENVNLQGDQVSISLCTIHWLRLLTSKYAMVISRNASEDLSVKYLALRGIWPQYDERS